MDFHIIHHNHNVADLNASLAFYEKALGMKECRRKEAADGSFIIVYLTDKAANFEIELTWVKDHPQKYGWANVSSTWPSAWPKRISMPLTTSMRAWAVSALRTPLWASISSKIPTATGWRSYPANKHSLQKAPL